MKIWLSRGEFIFRILFLCTALLTFNSFVYPTAVQPLFVKACVVLGILVLCGRALFYRDYIRTPGWWLFALFSLSFLVSIFVNRRYGVWFSDMKWVFWNGVMFFGLYVNDRTKSAAYYKKEFGVLSHIVIFYSAIAAVFGIAQMFSLYGEAVTTADSELILRGLQWERLWGVYTDPNYGAVLSVIAIFLALYYFFRSKMGLRILYVIGVLLNVLYVIFSDSRTAKVALCICAAVFIVFVCSRQRVWKRARRAVVSVLAFCLAAAVFVSCDHFLRAECNVKLQKLVDSENAKKSTGSGTKRPTRAQNISQDVSNGRLSIWQSALEVWKESPMVGTGYNSVVPFAEEQVPDTYIVNNGDTPYMSLHNAYLNVLVYQGIVGFVLMAAFAAVVARRVIVARKIMAQGDAFYFATLVIVILAAGIAAFFLAEIVYTISPVAVILWTFLGYLTHAVSDNTSREKLGYGIGECNHSGI